MLATLLVAVMTVSTLAGCGSKAPAASEAAPAAEATETAEAAPAAEEAAPAAEAPAASEGALRLINGKIEIDTMLKDLAKIYQEQTGQEVIIESIGGGVDIQGAVKSYYQSGNMPDMFVIGGAGDYANWDGMCADLSDCAFAKDTSLGYLDGDGKVVGFPYAVEGYGITYNADILEAAGVDPAGLVNYAAYEEAFAKIDSMKDELGLTAVASVAAEAGQMFWSTGNHIFGYYLSGGKDRNDKALLDKFLQGELDETRMNQFAKFVKLLFSYADEQTLISGTYDDQLALWAQGKTAFITQGNWIDASLADYNVTFNCGIAPLAFTEEDMPGVLADCPSWWVVYEDGENIDACKAFLDWCATSPEGQKCFVTDCGMVSPYSSCSVKPELPLAVSLSSFVAKDATYAWDWSSMPSDTSMTYTGLVFEAFAKGDLDEAGFVSMMEKQVKTCIESQ